MSGKYCSKETKCKTLVYPQQECTTTHTLTHCVSEHVIIIALSDTRGKTHMHLCTYTLMMKCLFTCPATNLKSRFSRKRTEDNEKRSSNCHIFCDLIAMVTLKPVSQEHTHTQAPSKIRGICD